MIDELFADTVVICHHEKLLIEPPSLFLFNFKGGFPYAACSGLA